MNSDIARDRRIEDIMNVLREEFIDTTLETVQELENLVETFENHVTADIQAGLMAVGRAIHNIKGQGSTYGFPAITAVSHRLEDYLGSIKLFTPDIVAEIYIFLDYIRTLLRGEDYQSETAIQALVRKLPVPPTIILSDCSGGVQGEVLVVMLRGLSQKLVCTQLEALGFRVSTCHSTTEGVRLANATRPDLIIVSAIMDVLSGGDMLRCLSVLENCQHIPAFLVSSLSDGHREFVNLPELTTLVRYDKDLAHSLNEAIATKFKK